MKKLLIGLSVLATSLLVLVGAGQAGASAKHAIAVKTVTVAMHDPGCHWFLVGGKYVKSVTRHGPVTLLNQDEAALRVKGPGGAKLERVGAKLTLRARGTYRITMVRQAPDDNHLTLTVK